MQRTPTGDPVPRVLTTATARSLGYQESQIRTALRRDRWQLLTRGVYLTRVDHPTRSDWIAAGLAIAGPSGVLSGWDAIRPHDLGSPRPPVDDVLVLSKEGTHRQVGRVRLRASARDVDSIAMSLADGSRGWAPMAAPARAVADTALVYRRFDPVRALVTEAVQRRLCTADDLVRELEAGPQNGSAHLRHAIEDVLLGVESISEAELADILAHASIPRPEFNVPVLRWDGVHLGTVDALWRHLRAGLEVDSKKHHFLESKWLGTMRRHNRLTVVGLAITHYPPRDLRGNPHAVASEVDQWLRGRARELGARYDQDSRSSILHTPFVLDPPAA